MATQFPSSGYILGVDYGESKIGLALASVVAKLPAPLGTINSKGSLAKIEEIVKEKDVKMVVVGAPKSLEGNETAQTQRARLFGENLRKNINQEVIFADETLSSVRAAKYIKDNRPADGDIDSIAACFILEEFLQNQRG